MTAAAGAGRLFLRRLRFDPGPALAMLALVAVTCFVFAALPRLANNVADEGLRYMVSNSPTASRNVRVVETERVPVAAGADPLAAVAERSARSEEGLPPLLQDLIAGSTFVVRSPRHVLQGDVESSASAPGVSVPGLTPRGLTRYLAIRLQSGVDGHIRLVSGRLPRA